MAKIVKFRTSKDDLIESLKYVLAKAEAGEIISFVLAAKCSDGNIATSWSKVDLGERNELVAHLQTDIMFDVMKANMDQLVEYI